MHVHQYQHLFSWLNKATSCYFKGLVSDDCQFPLGGQRSSTAWQLQTLDTQAWRDATRSQIMPCWWTRGGPLPSSSITTPSPELRRRTLSSTTALGEDPGIREEWQYGLDRLSSFICMAQETLLPPSVIPSHSILWSKSIEKPSGVTAAVSHWFLLLLLLPRLLRSLIGLKRVIINAAHFLVMKNKEFYRFYQTEPFLETVRGSMEWHFCHRIINFSKPLTFVPYWVDTWFPMLYFSSVGW